MKDNIEQGEVKEAMVDVCKRVGTISQLLEKEYDLYVNTLYYDHDNSGKKDKVMLLTRVDDFFYSFTDESELVKEVEGNSFIIIATPYSGDKFDIKIKCVISYYSNKRLKNYHGIDLDKIPWASEKERKLAEEENE